jgi:hypothetical protein
MLTPKVDRLLLVHRRSFVLAQLIQDLGNPSARRCNVIRVRRVRYALASCLDIGKSRCGLAKSQEAPSSFRKEACLASLQVLYVLLSSLQSGRFHLISTLHHKGWARQRNQLR